MSLQNKLETLKNKEKGSYGVAAHGFKANDVLLIAGVQQTKGGKTKTILTNRKLVVTGDSVKPNMIRGILLNESTGGLQGCVIALPTDVMTKVGYYDDETDAVVLTPIAEEVQVTEEVVSEEVQVTEEVLVSEEVQVTEEVVSEEVVSEEVLAKLSRKKN